MKRFEIKIGDKEIIFEIKDWAKRANSEVLVKCGETEVLVTTVMSDYDTSQGYFPLMVNYEERFYAKGEILGSRYLRRESRPSDNATLIARAIDRSIRPLFPKELKREVQIIVTCLSWDGENSPDVLGDLGASFALHYSNIPWDGPLGAIRVTQKNGQFILNPTYKEREKADLELFLTGIETERDTLINMIEMQGNEVEEEIVLKAVELALPEIRKLCKFQKEVKEKIGKEKIVIDGKKPSKILEKIQKEISDKARIEIEALLFGSNEKESESTLAKTSKLNRLKSEIAEEIRKTYEEEKDIENYVRTAEDIFEKEVGDLIHKKALNNKRVDGREHDQVRNLYCEPHPLSRVHGSGLFSRGLTTSLSVLTLAGPDDHQLIQGMEISGEKRFLHHYNFSTFSVGEVKPLRAPNRREIGHGTLAEKALQPVLPSEQDFPYTIRLVTEILTSNGSTSMAAVCSSTIALMDGGVPIKRPVAGIAIGLAQDGDDHQLLTDIQGPEDFHGDMDLKVAGTRQGVNMMQMDVKAKGISQEILSEALVRAKNARIKILDSIESAIPQPRPELSPYAPKVIRMQVSPDKIGMVIGSGGRMIRKICEMTESEVNVEDEGEIYIIAHKLENAKKAEQYIKDITRKVERGETFTGTVAEVTHFGAIIKLCPGHDGLLHKSRFKKPLKIGDKVKVKVGDVKPRGKIELALQEFS